MAAGWALPRPALRYSLRRGVQAVPAKHKPVPGEAGCDVLEETGSATEVCVLCFADPRACLQPGDQGGAASAL